MNPKLARAAKARGQEGDGASSMTGTSLSGQYFPQTPRTSRRIGASATRAKWIGEAVSLKTACPS